MSMTLQTERLILRRPEPGDWGAFRAFMLSERSSVLGSTQHVGSAWRIFAAKLGHWEMRGYGPWSVTIRGDNDAVALVGPWTPDDWPETEISWIALDADVEGTGVAYEAAKAAITHAYNALNWQTAVSYIAPSNDRSIKLAKRLGATLDIHAKVPDPENPCLVYRHPDPQEGQR